MGANNSAPQTARIENPECRIAVQVSPSVVTRIENAQKQNEEKLNVKTLDNGAVHNLQDLQRQEQQTSIRHDAQDQQQKEEQSKEQPEQRQTQQPYEGEGKSYGQQSYKQKSDEQRTYQHSYTHNLNRRRDRENGGKYNQYEDREFGNCVASLENYLGKPVQWTNNIDGEILELRNELIACHREHPGEPLCCAELAEKYQDLIFREQFLSILRFNRKSDEEERDQDGDGNGDGNGDGDGDEEQLPQDEQSEEQPVEVNYSTSQN
uniref:Uncharacterized protein n=1 Tax=Glossina austeni TaxID=7395 RepID=A0A1A9ULN1_GLOAU